jgi:hypothetical protein
LFTAEGQQLLGEAQQTMGDPSSIRYSGNGMNG